MFMHGEDMSMYFIMFTNDYSRFGYVYLMPRKFDVLEKFIEFNGVEKCM